MPPNDPESEFLARKDERPPFPIQAHGGETGARGIDDTSKEHAKLPPRKCRPRKKKVSIPPLAVSTTFDFSKDTFLRFAAKWKPVINNRIQQSRFLSVLRMVDESTGINFTSIFCPIV